MTWILTHSGEPFDYTDPTGTLPSIETIAHALSHICRFGGHTREFYSVAQHCYLASHIVPAEYALDALLHDAAEAFIGDMPQPLKAMLPEYKSLENRIERALFTRFGVTTNRPEIKHADRVLLATERRDLMPEHPSVWVLLEGIEPMADRIHPMPPHIARRAFLDRWIILNRPDQKGIDGYRHFRQA